MKIRIKVGFLYGVKKGEILETNSSQEDCYIVYSKGEELLINHSLCEVIKEDKQCNNCYWNSEKEENRCIETTVKKCIDNNYKWWAKIEETNKLKQTKKDIELPNEFYFRFKDDKDEEIFEAIKKENRYKIFSDSKYITDYSINLIKNNIKNKYLIIADKQINDKFDKNNIVKGKDQQKGYVENKENDEIEELSEKLYHEFNEMVNNISNINKKSNKIIALTSMEGFKTYIAKDKFVSVVQYEQYSFITTVAIEGTFTVVEKTEDIIKMLEE